MATNKKALAKELCELHPGIPNEDVSAELLDHFMMAIRTHLLREGELHLDGVGTLVVRQYAGADEKRDARTDITYKVTPRRVLKFVVSDGFKKVINMDRKPSVPIERSEDGEA